MLEKLKKFFRNLFKIEDKRYLEAPKEIIEPVNNASVSNKNDFINQIIVDNSKNDRALKLQKDFKEGLIEEEDLSEEDFELLSNLYENQIESIKKSIQSYKDKIVSIKNQLVKNN